MDADIPVDGAQLRYSRQRAGLSQEALAAAVRAEGGQMSGISISRVERGVRRSFRVSNYRLVCRALGVEHDHLRVDRRSSGSVKTPV
jgi:transcriptional regulator with XRE-family HTH domain